jgi:hypothetical protein
MQLAVLSICTPVSCSHIELAPCANKKRRVQITRQAPTPSFAHRAQFESLTECGPPGPRPLSVSTTHRQLPTRESLRQERHVILHETRRRITSAEEP